MSEINNQTNFSSLAFVFVKSGKVICGIRDIPISWYFRFDIVISALHV